MLWQQKISSTLWHLAPIIAKDNGKNSDVGSSTTGPRKELHMESIWFKISMPAQFWRGLRRRSKAKELLSGGNGVQSVRAIPGQADGLGAPVTTWGRAAVPGGPTFCSVHSQSPKGDFWRGSGSIKQDRSATNSSAVWQQVGLHLCKRTRYLNPQRDLHVYSSCHEKVKHKSLVFWDKTIIISFQKMYILKERMVWGLEEHIFWRCRKALFIHSHMLLVAFKKKIKESIAKQNFYGFSCAKGKLI